MLRVAVLVGVPAPAKIFARNMATWRAMLFIRGSILLLWLMDRLNDQHLPSLSQAARHKEYP
jgi:hypothetical protein